MKFEKNPKYNTYALLAIIVAAFSGLLISLAVHADSVLAAVSKFVSVLAPLFCAVIIMLVLLPGVDFFNGKFKKALKRFKHYEKKAEILSIVCVYLILLAVIVLAVVIVIPQFSILYEFIIGSTDYIAAVDKFSEEIAGESEFLGERFAELINRVENALFDYIKALPTLATKIAATLGKIVTRVSDWILGLIISVYALLRRERLKAIGRKINAALFSGKASASVASVCREFYSHTVWFFSGRAYNMLALAIVFYAALLLMGLRFHPIICLTIAICSLVPVLGILVGGSIGALIVLITDTDMTVWYLLVFFVIMILNHIFLRPRLTNKKVRVGLGTSMVCVLVGYFILNLTGALFAVPVYVTIRGIFGKWRAKKMAMKE